MEETARAWKGKESMSGAREIRIVSPGSMVDKENEEERASGEVSHYVPVSMEAGPSQQPKSVSQAELIAELLLTLRAMREMMEEKDKKIAELTREELTKKRCKPNPPPTPFTGSGKMVKVKDFLVETELYFEAQGASEPEKVQVATTFLKDRAWEWGRRDEASTSSGHQSDHSQENIERSTLGRPGLRLREGSSRYGDNYITVTSSHFYVCRPSDKTSNEYRHLQTLIQDVLRRVELERKQYLIVPKVTVGFDRLVTEALETHHAFVGICGMGGIGKTTLAKLILNRACMKFEFTCFSEQIKELTGPKSQMKKVVWEQMRHRGAPVRKADQVHEDVWYQVKGKSLLVVFDDVDNYQQPEFLREIAEDNQCSESRFILTSRNSHLLQEVYGDNIHIIRPNHLGNEDAKKLLTAYAFPKKPEPPESLRKVVQEVLDGCEGLPLTLEILGKHLRCTPMELWAEIPSALRRCTNDCADLEQRLWARLQLSYDGLPGDDVKKMFLDIASFFILQDKWGWQNPFADDAIMAWSSIYTSVLHHLQTLEDRSLVMVRRYKDPMYDVTRTNFYMHEHLRRMGQKIAREKGRSLDISRVRSSAEPTSEDQNLYQYDGEVIFQVLQCQH
ncbi:hypothetical protein R1sor_019661 [Riccia sorocarpa]|uniref:NB-ARC domain-containing protein n=1 Tax=Riccia sorocarpa TaxID=122646 RepID=A0ABD3IGG4_9MARC